MSEFKNTLAEINRLDISEEKISEFEGTAIETIQNGTHREKISKNMWRTVGGHETI